MNSSNQSDMAPMHRVTHNLSRGPRAVYENARAALRHRSGSLWVFGGASGKSYSDNSRELFETVARLHPEVDLCWVMNQGAADRELAASIGQVATRDTPAAHRLTAEADVIVFSHGAQDVPGMLWNRSAVRVRLGHGLTAFKRNRGRMPLSRRRMVAAVDLAPVASTMEQNFKLEWGFRREQLPITGLPRWDRVLRERERLPSIRRRRVLLAPTWRSWHKAQDLQISGRLGPWLTLLTSRGLQRLAWAFDAELVLYLHQNMRSEVLQRLQSPGHFSILDRDADVEHVLAAADLVVTDYSSIGWDALYAGVPTILYHYDRSELERNVGSHLDLDKPLFGPTTRTARETLVGIEEALAGERGAAWIDLEKEWRQRAFAYVDQGNAERVLGEITTLLAHRAR